MRRAPYKANLKRLAKGLAPRFPLTRREFLAKASRLAAGSVLLGGLGAAGAPAQAAPVSLPAWTSPTAISDVFVVGNLPKPNHSLAGGSLPAGVAPASALRDAGIDALVALMNRRGAPFHRTLARPEGIVPRDAAVVIKINNQWSGQGSGSGLGRLGTNTDLLKGLIWRILDHPEVFSGEVVVAENVQPLGVNDFGMTPANAEDQNQSVADVVAVFAGLGHPVSTFNWTSLNDSALAGGTMGTGPATCEYASGDMADAYVLLDDPDVSARNVYSKFTTAGGRRISMRHGLWDGAAYDPDRLCLINMPVLKKHCMAGATAAWKNIVGFVSCRGFDSGDNQRFASWDEMHGYFWGYQDLGPAGYGLIGRQLALVRAPDLNIIDAVWVATYNNYSSAEAVRLDTVLASRDPFAADWYASEYLLRPVVPYAPSDSSLARAGVFRSASLVNQKAAKAQWQGGYPYLDLVADHAGDSVLTAERDQLNAYLGQVQLLPPAVDGLLLDGETV